MTPISAESIIPRGILPTDRWHCGVDDRRCSRCGQTPPESDVPILLWRNDGRDMLRYCEECLGTREQEACLACAEPIAPDAPTYPDVNGGCLCAACAPTYAALLGGDEAFVDMDTLEPMSADQRRAVYDAHIAAGGSAEDSMAS
jgi:hypothetical protein